MAKLELNRSDIDALKASDEKARRAMNTVGKVRIGLKPNARPQEAETISSGMNKGSGAYQNNLEMNKAIEDMVDRLAKELKKKKPKDSNET